MHSGDFSAIRCGLSANSRDINRWFYRGEVGRVYVDWSISLRSGCAVCSSDVQVSISCIVEEGTRPDSRKGFSLSCCVWKYCSLSQLENVCSQLAPSNMNAAYCISYVKDVQSPLYGVWAGKSGIGGLTALRSDGLWYKCEDWVCQFTCLSWTGDVVWHTSSWENGCCELQLCMLAISCDQSYVESAYSTM